MSTPHDDSPEVAATTWLAEQRAGVLAATAFVLTRGEQEAARAKFDELRARYEPERNRAFGNRPPNYLVGWTDERLVLAAALRVCLAVLEETP